MVGMLSPSLLGDDFKSVLPEEPFSNELSGVVRSDLTPVNIYHM